MINHSDEILKNHDNGFNVHDHLKNKTVEELKAICDAERNPFWVCALSLNGDLNVGSIVRTSSLCGAKEVFIIGRRKYDKRGTVGSQNYIKIHRIDGLTDDNEIDHDVFINVMKENHLSPIFVELGGHCISNKNFDWHSILNSQMQPCLVFGNEGKGIPDELIIRCKKEFQYTAVVSIAQKGVIRSHNVSIASGIIMHDMCKSMGWYL